MYCLICPSQEIYSHLFECSYFQLSENISRPLLGLLKKMGEEIPKPLVDGIFVPLVMSKDQCKYYSTVAVIRQRSSNDYMYKLQ